MKRRLTHDCRKFPSDIGFLFCDPRQRHEGIVARWRQVVIFRRSSLARSRESSSTHPFRTGSSIVHHFPSIKSRLKHGAHLRAERPHRRPISLFFDGGPRLSGPNRLFRTHSPLPRELGELGRIRDGTLICAVGSRPNATTEFARYGLPNIARGFNPGF